MVKIGLATKGAVQSNEAYVSQYLDHHIWQGAKSLLFYRDKINRKMRSFQPLFKGVFKISRLLNGRLSIFGRSFKQTNTPEALGKRYLANEVYQYEFAYTALQTEAVQLTNESKEFVFMVR